MRKTLLLASLLTLGSMGIIDSSTLNKPSVMAELQFERQLEKERKQQQHHEKEERLRTYQKDDEISIPFLARFLPKKHKGKNFIRVCEGKFCAWSQ